MFFPGETVTHKFVLPFPAGDIDYVVFSYKQNDYIVFEKQIASGFEELSVDSCSVSFAFSQEDGMRFLDNTPFTIQCNIFTKGQSRHTSYVMKGFSGIQYLREVMDSGD